MIIIDQINLFRVNFKMFSYLKKHLNTRRQRSIQRTNVPQWCHHYQPIIRNELPKNKIGAIFQARLVDNTQEKTEEQFVYNEDDVRYRDRITNHLVERPAEQKLFFELCSKYEVDHKVVDGRCLNKKEFIDLLERINYPENRSYRLYTIAVEEEFIDNGSIYLNVRRKC